MRTIIEIIFISFYVIFKAEKLPLAEVEEVIKSTGTVEDDEGMIKYDGKFKIIIFYLICNEKILILIHLFKLLSRKSWPGHSLKITNFVFS